MVHRIFYTATVIRFDGSDTNAYGEGCLPGHGYTEETGWHDPDWSADAVYDNRPAVRPDVYRTGDELDPVTWLVDRLIHRLRGWGPSDDGRTFYSSDADQLYDRHCDVTVAAHPYGFSAEEIAEANRILAMPGVGALDHVRNVRRNAYV